VTSATNLDRKSGVAEWRDLWFGNVDLGKRAWRSTREIPH
jgi:hypothetical protein